MTATKTYQVMQIAFGDAIINWRWIFKQFCHFKGDKYLLKVTSVLDMLEPREMTNQ